MGYAKPQQTTAGIHQRLRARAFVLSKKGTIDNDNAIPLYQHTMKPFSFWERWKLAWWRHEESSSSHSSSSSRLRTQRDTSHDDNTFFLDATQTICFVSIDTGMGSDLLNMRVLQRLETLLPAEAQGLCTMPTLSISGTHTHRQVSEGMCGNIGGFLIF